MLISVYIYGRGGVDSAPWLPSTERQTETRRKGYTKRRKPVFLLCALLPSNPPPSPSMSQPQGDINLVEQGPGTSTEQLLGLHSSLPLH